MAWLLALVLLLEGLVIAAVNWFLGVVVERQRMSMGGLDPDVMSLASKGGGILFGLYFLLCAYVALLVALRDRAPAGFGRVVLVSAAVVHGLLGALTWGLVGLGAFLSMVAVLALIVLLLMTYDAQGAREESAGPEPTGEAAPA
ncbi:hypothetical protein [Streptomyces sp. NPDC053367]|uniref:hypothetical protein n=1 Tax=Streptomyces sp. NPDC053367 TaxID=3365700 RepID=UPI0037D0D3F3